MRQTLIAGNWKMNGSESLISEMIQTLSPLQPANTTIVVCPPSIYLKKLQEVAEHTSVKIGAQNVHHESKGAFTGEASVTMLSEYGVQYCIVGHSERRAYFHETDELVNQKLQLLLAQQVSPILCVGESLEQREANAYEDVISSQLKAGLAGLGAEQLQSCVVAYEPIWAIGTGKTATPEQAEDVHVMIRSTIQELFGADAAEQLQILYGGSANAGNAASLLSQSNIDGLLVGGASLKPQDFSVIINAGA